ncbi:MAG: hypothetical protein ABIE14_02715 [Patescibacteria group bacterium]
MLKRERNVVADFKREIKKFCERSGPACRQAGRTEKKPLFLQPAVVRHSERRLGKEGFGEI